MRLSFRSCDPIGATGVDRFCHRAARVAERPVYAFEEIDHDDDAG